MYTVKVVRLKWSKIQDEELISTFLEREMVEDVYNDVIGYQLGTHSIQLLFKNGAATVVKFEEVYITPDEEGQQRYLDEYQKMIDVASTPVEDTVH